MHCDYGKAHAILELRYIQLMQQKRDASLHPYPQYERLAVVVIVTISILETVTSFYAPIVPIKNRLAYHYERREHIKTNEYEESYD